MADIRLRLLAEEIRHKLNATPAPDAPPRASFDGGEMTFGETEFSVKFTDVGYLFISLAADGSPVVEAVVVKDLERTEKRRRHRKLLKLSEKLFNNDLVVHDSQGFIDGKPKGTPS